MISIERASTSSRPPFTRKQVIEQVDRMHAHEHGLRRADVTHDKRNMLGIFDRVHVEHHAEPSAEMALDVGLDRTGDEMVMAPSIGDEIGDGADLEAVQLGELHEGRAGAPWCRRRS
jgi:hypothetical protein